MWRSAKTVQIEKFDIVFRPQIPNPSSDDYSVKIGLDQ